MGPKTLGPSDLKKLEGTRPSGPIGWLRLCSHCTAVAAKTALGRRCCNQLVEKSSNKSTRKIIILIEITITSIKIRGPIYKISYDNLTIILR